MALPTIVTRTSKGSALSFAEADANFTNLRDAVISVTDGTTSSDIALNGTLAFTAGTGISLSESAGAITINSTGSSVALDDLTDVTISAPSTGNILQYGAGGWANQTASFQLSSDFAPQLAADLDSNDFAITNSNAGGDVTLTPNSGGKSIVNNINYYETPYALGSTDAPSIDVANGNVQTVTIASGLALPAFTTAVTGQSVTLIVSGSGTASGTANHKFANGDTTLTTLSVVSIFYDGTNYYTSIATNFQ